MYPTLVELCGLPKNELIEGRSIVSLIRDPEAKWPYPALITHSPHWLGNNHAVRSERWHYIRYADGGEELYDMNHDPNQWTNVITNPKHQPIKTELRQWLPKTYAPHYRGKSATPGI
ncbi:MAG: arylsulfatase A-like enzyme [Limisphaerales bacterium]|jgi:arylsulfatase A-like enzyme